MARFELYDSDDILDEDSNVFETVCPVCGKDISFSLNDFGSQIVCPHCKAEIAIESE